MDVINSPRYDPTFLFLSRAEGRKNKRGERGEEERREREKERRERSREK